MDRMKKGIVAAVVVVVPLGTCTAYVSYDGEGEHIKPNTRWYESTKSYFKIDNARQLAGPTYLVNHGASFQGKFIALTSDIQLHGQWTPIGMGKYDGASHSVYEAAFDAIFNGNGHSISGLRISTSSAAECIGLFGVVAGGIVRDVALIDVRIDSPSADCVGGIAGTLCGSGIISGCNIAVMNDGSAISSDKYTGGVAGRIASKTIVNNCTNFASVSSPDGPGCGGIVAETVEDIPESVTCETSSVKIVIPEWTSINGMAINFPDSSFTIYQASCNAGMLKISSKATSSSTAVFEHNNSFRILDDADVLVTMDCPIPEGAVPEVHLCGMEWRDLEVVGYTSVTIAFRTALDGEIAIILHVPDSEAGA